MSLSPIKSLLRGIKPPSPSLQELLLRAALAESGFRNQEYQIRIDHINGVSNVNEVSLGIVYPREFQVKAFKQIGVKTLKYSFDGVITATGGRQQMLKPFFNRADSEVVHSKKGRIYLYKGRFNMNYYKKLGATQFCLCPHHVDWPGPAETMWTYRFVEACLTFAIPVVFRNAPLGDAFINGFRYLYDDEIHDYKESDAIHNWELASKRFFLTETSISRICMNMRI